MSIWMWVIAVLVGIVVLFVLLEITFWIRSRSDERKLSEDPDYMRRLVQEGNTALLLKSLHSFSPKVSAEAAAALAKLKDPSTIPSLLLAYFGRLQEAEREPYAQALEAMPGEEVVPLLIKRMGGRNDEPVIDLLRRFDMPEARELVDKFDKERAEVQAEIERRRKIVDGLLSETAESERGVISLPLPIETGGSAVASKIVGGMLTGGMMAVTPNKFTLDDLVKLPEVCSLCGCLPGKKDRWASCSFKMASAGWGIVGVNTQGEAILTYKVCPECYQIDEKASAIKITVESDEQKALFLHVNVLNPEIKRQVQELNSTHS